MPKEIDEMLASVNAGVIRDRMDFSDVTCVMLYLFGIHRDDAYYLTKCKGAISDSVLADRSKAYFNVERVKELIDAARPIVDQKMEKTPTGDGFTVDWAAIEVDALTAEELEKMGTTMLRAASVSSDTSPKDINDMIKMLDSIGALPKKKAEDKDFKQVIIKPVFNAVCDNCGHELYVSPAEHACVEEKVETKKKRTSKKDSEIVDIP